MSEKQSPEYPEWNDEVKQDSSAGTGWRYVYGRFGPDHRHNFDEEWNLIPPKTGAQRQKAYEQEQSQGDKKRPGWWLSEEVIKTITDRQWIHPWLYLGRDKKAWQSSRKTKSDRIDLELRYMLRIVEAVESKIRETGYMDPEEAIDLVLERIAALEVPHVSEEEFLERLGLTP